MSHISNLLGEAYSELSRSELPEPLWPAALPTVLDLLLSPTSAEAGTPSTQLQPPARSGGKEWATILAGKVRVAASSLEEVFDLEDGEPRLIVPPSRLPAQKAPAMKVVSLLVAAARQGIGADDGWTASAVLREACKEIGVFDRANYAAELTTVDGLAFKGSGASRRVKVTGRGFEIAGAEIRQLAGAEN